MEPSRRFRFFFLATMITTIVGMIILAGFLCQNIPLVVSNSTTPYVRQLTELDEDVSRIVWKPDGTQLAFVRWEKPVEVRDARSLSPVETIGADKRIVQFAFSPNPGIVAFSENNNTVEILDTRTRKSLLLELDSPEWVIDAKFSPDGLKLLTSGGTMQPGHRNVQVWGVRVRDRLLGSLGL